MDDASEGGELVQTVGPLLGPMAQMPIGPAESKATERSITLSAPDCEGMLGSDPELPDVGSYPQAAVVRKCQ